MSKMTPFPWYRFYSETLSDRKMARICRSSGLPKATVIGVWAILLSLASESPRRGELLISDDLPLSPDEIQEETGLDEDAFTAIVNGLSTYGLIDTSGPCWMISNWDRRQPPSDNSTERVRQYRERQRTVTPPTPPKGNTPLQKRDSNVLEKEEDKEAEAEAERESARAPAPAVVRSVADRTPSGFRARNGYHPPTDKPIPGDDEPEMVSTAPAAVRILARLTSYWPGDDVAPALVKRFGDVPDEAALARAVELWRLSGHKITNWLGIADWYDELRRNPGWTPQDRFKNGSANGHGKPPAKTVSKPAPGSQPVTW